MTPERKVVVITGASRGIGAQLSKAYRHIGYQVIASSRSMRKSDDPAILVIEGDITRPETAERILGTAAERFGRIDTLVNNAGVFIAKPFTEYSEEDFATMIAVNLAGFFYLSPSRRSGLDERAMVPAVRPLRSLSTPRGWPGLTPDPIQQK
jgi:NAD(P)-dependent dehydrogenase (short-subunit alcohol dehydrogenase family)